VPVTFGFSAIRKMSEDDEMYEPEEILATRHKKGKKEVLVKWVGYGTDDNSWEPLHNFEELDVWKKYQLNSKKATKEVKMTDANVEEKQKARGRGKEHKYLMKLEENSCSSTKDDTDEADESCHYKVEKILKERTTGSIKEYLVRWDGYDSTHDTWEPEEGIGHTLAYDKWIAKNSKKRKKKRASRPPKRRKRKSCKLSEENETEEVEKPSLPRKRQKQKCSLIFKQNESNEFEKLSPSRTRHERKHSMDENKEDNESDEVEKISSPGELQQRKPSLISESGESEEVKKPSPLMKCEARKPCISESDRSEKVEQKPENATDVVEKLSTPQEHEQRKPSLLSEDVESKKVQPPSPLWKPQTMQSTISQEKKINEVEKSSPSRLDSIPRKREKRKFSSISQEDEIEDIEKPPPPRKRQRRSPSFLEEEEDESEEVRESSETLKYEALASLDRYMRGSFKFPYTDESDDEEEESISEGDVEESDTDSEEISKGDAEEEDEEDTEESTKSDAGKTSMKHKAPKISGSVRKSRLKQAGAKKRKSLTPSSHVELSMFSRLTQRKVGEIQDSGKSHKLKRISAPGGTREQRLEAAEKKKVEIWQDIRKRGLAREFGKRYPRAMPRRKFAGEAPERVREALDAEILFKQIKCIPKEAQAIAKEIYSWRWEDE